MSNNDINQNIATTDIAVTPADLAVNPAIREPEADADELTVAEREAAASGDAYEHAFKKPVAYNNLIIREIRFDWDLLTGQDSLDIENELQALGKVVITPAFSGEYLIRMAARASAPKVGADFFARLPLSEYNRIRSAARSFLLTAE